jgi:hypothetical protein
MRNIVKTFGARGEWQIAAEKFADYWGGAGSWAQTPPTRRDALAQSLKPNFFEWDAVMKSLRCGNGQNCCRGERSW